MERIKLNFADFWGHFNKHDNYFVKLLRNRFEVEISNDPDFLIYSCYGEDHLKYNCSRIFYNGENQKVNWNACDYAFSFDYPSGNSRLYRLPNWVLYDDPQLLIKKNIDPPSILRQKTGFCSMVVSNPYAQKRLKFFNLLSTYKRVDSGGRVLNNIAGPVEHKREFICKYKFAIAFENSSAEGYTTEKLFEPMLENAIPIYWGNPSVSRDFNTKSFVNYHDFANEKDLIDRIIELDTDDKLYMNMLAEPWYHNNRMPDYLNEKSILDQFDLIFSNSDRVKPVAQTFSRHLYFLERCLHKSDFQLNKIFRYRKPFR